MNNFKENAIFADNYRLIKQIGLGGFAEVWSAIDLQTDLTIAIKIYIQLDEEGQEQAKQEFIKAFRLKHNYILTPSYFNIHEGQPFIVMTYCSQGTALKKAGNITEEELAKLIFHISSSVEYIHDLNPPIIHRDIKPDNFLIDDNGNYLLTDFGISNEMRRALTKSVAASRKTVVKKEKNTSGSTPNAYKAPELFSKDYEQRKPIKANDVFSLGVSFFEMTTGDFPFGEYGGTMLYQEGIEAPNIPEKYSQGLNQLIQRCLAKDAWDRPTAAEIKDYAQHYLKYGNWNLTKETDTPTPQKKEKKSSKKFVIAFAALVVVAAIIFGVFYFNESSKKKDFAELLTAGTELFDSGSYIQAKDKFLNAQKIIDNDDVQNKIKACTDSVEMGYKRNLEAGYAKVKQEDYLDAFLFYKEALKYKPEDDVLIAKMDSLSSTINELYNAALEAGKGFMEEKKFAEAKEQFEKAKSIKPDNTEVAGLISQIDVEIEKEYNSCMTKGNEFLEKSQYSKAKQYFRKALTYKPDDAEAKRKLNEMPKRLYENPRITKGNKGKYRHLKLLRIEITDKETIVTFKYKFTGSNNIMSLYPPKSSGAFYIRDYSGNKYKLLRARGISFGVEQKIYSTKTFSLIFKKLPSHVTKIDIIEGTNQIVESMTYWNFKGVILK